MSPEKNATNAAPSVKVTDVMKSAKTAQIANMNTSMNIFFVGLMGAGKTTVGRAVARRLNRLFIDSDHEIETRTGARIPMIFDLEGEEGFREREAQVINELTHRKGIVLATGGGAVLRPENRHALASRGVVVYLRANVHDLWLRTRRDRNRPLLQTEDPKMRLEVLYQARDPLYHEVADFVIDSSGASSVSILVNTVLMQLELAGIRSASTNTSNSGNGASSARVPGQQGHQGHQD